MRKLIFAVLVLLIAGYSGAQQFGGNPPSVRWSQINTDTARIIFPVGLDSQANRIASIVHYLQKEKPLSLGDKLRKINIVLQNQTTVSNAYVGLGPFRSEFYLTPVAGNFDEGSISWPDQLALHEYRHVQQYNNFNTGLSKVMSTLFGDDGLSLAINAAVPDWFYEGDAVYNETILSNQGRGRLPLFINAYPSLWQAGKKYSWMKLRNGSLKDYVPNHYYLGYLLVNYGREKYGTDFWTKVTQDAAAYKGLFYPFQKAIKKYAGVDYKTFREQALASYRSRVENAATDKSFVFPVEKDYVTSYHFPYSIGADSLLYLKTSMRHRPAFYIKHGNDENKIKVRDISLDEQFSYRNGKIVYCAYELDARWAWQDYSVIRIVNVQTGEQHKLTKRSKYFSPDISSDGSKVVAVQNSDNGKSELHVLNSTTGEVMNKLHSTEISVFADPKFINDSSLVTAVRLKDGKMALALAEINTGNIMRLTAPSYNIVGYPSVSNGMIYFTASYNGNDDVFVLRMQDNKIARITTGPLGNYFVNASNGTITWSAFTAEGYQLQQKEANAIEWQEVSVASQDNFIEKFPVSHENEFGDVLLDKVPQRAFPVKKYKKGTGLINFHSWRPYYEDPIFTYTLYGKNILNTMQTEVYYLYNENERTSAVGFNAVYGGWYPFIDVGTEFTFDVQQEITPAISRHWNQLNTHAGLIIQLNPVSGQTYKNFSIGSYYVLRNEYNKGIFKDSIGVTSFSYLQHFITWSQRVQQAAQHIYPRAGYAVSMTHRHAITKYNGYQFIGNGTVYAPGLLSNHNILVTGAFQQRDTLGEIGFGNRFSYSRGYIGRYFSRMWRLSANYHFPLWHPDWGVANILYIQRIRANAFYDFTKVYSRDKLITANQRSVGGELFFDTKWWNQYPLTFGFRVSHMMDRDQFDGFKGTVFEFIMPVNIIPR